MKLLLSLTALSEGLVGLLLMIVPSMVVPVLFSGELETQIANAVGRVAGAAICSLAIVCWQLRSAGSIGVVIALLFYNISVNTIFVYVAVGVGLQGPLLWPAIVVHYALAAWCGVLMWFEKRQARISDAVE